MPKTRYPVFDRSVAALRGMPPDQNKAAAAEREYEKDTAVKTSKLIDDASTFCLALARAAAADWIAGRRHVWAGRLL